MKMFLVVIMLLNVFIGFSNLQRCSWSTISSEVKRVYTAPISKGEIEMIRLYKNNQFEHLNYLPTYGSKVEKTNSDVPQNYLLERQIGSYTLKKGKLSLTYLHPTTSVIEKHKIYIVEGGKLYENRWQSFFNKERFRFKVPVKTSVHFPFYMAPTSGEIVSNTEANEYLNLTDLVTFITKKQFTSNDKINQISKFLINSLKNNCKESKDLISVNEEQLVKNILTGKDRTANSYEFATALKVLSNYADLSVNTIEGQLKKSKGFGYEYIPCYWNGLQTADNYFFYDISLGGDWMNINPSVMIHSHFPKDTINQRLNRALTWDEFTNRNYLTPTNGVQKSISFFPTSQFLHVNKDVEIILSETPKSIEFFEFDTLQDSFLEKSIPIKFSVTQLNHSNLLVRFFNLFKKGKLIAQMNSNISVSYLIIPDECSENGVSLYLSQFNLDKTTKTEEKCIVSIINSVIPEGKLTINNTSYLNDFKRYKINPLIVSKNPIILEALKYYGVEEIEGEKSNALITSFFKETGNQKIASDNNAWCSVFVGYCAKKTGYVSFAKANAKSWLNVGKVINEPQPGDIVVFWRETPSSWKGHVAIYIGKDALTGNIICLGGNQDDKVCLSLFNTSNVLGYRRLVKPTS